MQKPVLLYIDDDAKDLLLFEDACRAAEAAFTLKLANEGEAAIRYFDETLRDPESEAFPWPSGILLDIKMPRLSGFDVLEEIRKRPLFRTIPVIVFTSSRHEQDIHRSYELGANSYLVKSVDFQELIQIIRLIDQYWLHLNQTTRTQKRESESSPDFSFRQ